MPLYDFRLQFSCPNSYRIECEEVELELLALPHGERIRLCSDAVGEPINKYTRAAILGGSFSTEYLARNAAENSKRSLLYWALDRRLGIDFGEGAPKSGVTNIGLAMLQKIHGHPHRNAKHGIDVYEHVDNLRFVSVGTTATVGKHPPKFIDIFQHEYLNNRRFTEKQLLASEIYSSSYFDVSARNRFITLVKAIEALLEPSKRSDETQTLVTELEATIKMSMTDNPTKSSITSSLEALRHQSIGEAGRMLVHLLLPNETIGGKTSRNFFTHCYNLRSRILHDGKISKSVHIGQLANSMEIFVNHLLISALNNEP